MTLWTPPPSTHLWVAGFLLAVLTWKCGRKRIWPDPREIVEACGYGSLLHGLALMLKSALTRPEDPASPVFFCSMAVVALVAFKAMWGLLTGEAKPNATPSPVANVVTTALPAETKPEG